MVPNVILKGEEMSGESSSEAWYYPEEGLCSSKYIGMQSLSNQVGSPAE